jgi:hypothetical protein
LGVDQAVLCETRTSHKRVMRTTRVLSWKQREGYQVRYKAAVQGCGGPRTGAYLISVGVGRRGWCEDLVSGVVRPLEDGASMLSESRKDRHRYPCVSMPGSICVTRAVRIIMSEEGCVYDDVEALLRIEFVSGPETFLFGALGPGCSDRRSLLI